VSPWKALSPRRFLHGAREFRSHDGLYFKARIEGRSDPLLVRAELAHRARDDWRQSPARDWAKYFESVGVRPIRCAGPEAMTCALSLEKRCPLHQEADFIFYDEESVTPQLEAQLGTLPPHAPIAYARTKIGPDGREFPVATRIFSRTQRPAEACR
jgi:hypothetical protein